ncbi:MAG: N-acetylglucosamine-6-phosphate deacetylase [Betaproteobacteria bacterium]|nr:N-acetylglucosamine-6-phosphate deacetylase [Betaproteobacteria bacterium]
MTTAVLRLEGCVLTADGWLQGAIDIGGDGRIVSVTGRPISEEAARNASQPLVLPGFIDTHVHGGGGRDIMEGGDAAVVIAREHARHGTTALVATTMTAPMADIDGAFAALAPVCKASRNGAARVLGVHLEGPYLNPGKLGAQPDYAVHLNLADVARLNAIAPIRLLTLAPEVDDHIAMIPALVAMGIRVQSGHSLASYEDGVKAMQAGAAGFTHLFNAMTAMHHRKPGLVGAALAHAEYAEIIPDLLHVHPGAIRAAMRAIPKLFCVTDSTAAAGMPDGEYRLGRHTVTKCMGGVRLADGTLAGSTLTMEQALKNCIDTLGLGIADASARVSMHAADYLGLTNRGRLAPGAWADVAVLDRDLNLTAVYAEGVAVSR